VLILLADHSMDWSRPDRLISLAPVFDADPLLAGRVTIAAGRAVATTAAAGADPVAIRPTPKRRPRATSFRRTSTPSLNESDESIRRRCTYPTRQVALAGELLDLLARQMMGVTENLATVLHLEAPGSANEALYVP